MIGADAGPILRDALAPRACGRRVRHRLRALRLADRPWRAGLLRVLDRRPALEHAVRPGARRAAAGGAPPEGRLAVRLPADLPRPRLAVRAAAPRPRLPALGGAGERRLHLRRRAPGEAGVGDRGAGAGAGGVLLGRARADLAG